MKSKIMGISDYQLYHNIFDADISFVGGYKSTPKTFTSPKGVEVDIDTIILSPPFTLSPFSFVYE